MDKIEKKTYESKKIYGKKYNESNINIQLDRELIMRLRDKIKPLTIKSYLEDLIKKKLD
jgi:hypothetical protein